MYLFIYSFIYFILINLLVQQDLHKLNKRRIHAGFVYIFNHMMTVDTNQNDKDNHKNNDK